MKEKNAGESPLAQNEPCPCGSGRPFGLCCAPLLAGGRAPTAEALMRSRYTAFALGAAGYLGETWHSSTRPVPLDAGSGPCWRRLEILHVEGGGPEAEEGRVEFAAHYADGRGEGVLHETSRFVREGGRWVYLDGVIHPEARQRPGRNSPCPCNSGRKFKHCCGR